MVVETWGERMPATKGNFPVRNGNPKQRIRAQAGSCFDLECGDGEAYRCRIQV